MGNLTDPLAEDDPPPPPAPDRAGGAGDIAVPDVTGLQGQDAVHAVREDGLIAAIDAVPSQDDASVGVVLSQDPPAGSPAGREAIVTLTIATPQDPGGREQTPAPDDHDPGEEEAAEAEEGEQDAGEDADVEAQGDALGDDTEEWFAALAAAGDPQPEQGSARRQRRQHPTPTAQPAEHPVSDPPSGPAAGVWLGVWPPLRARIRVGVAWVRAWRWRYPAGLAACVLLGALIAAGLTNHPSPSATAQIARPAPPVAPVAGPPPGPRGAPHRRRRGRPRAVRVVRVVVLREETPPPTAPPPAAVTGASVRPQRAVNELQLAFER